VNDARMQERDAYLLLAEKGSQLFFVIGDLCKINNMYRFSLASFLSLFQRALHNKQVSAHPLSFLRRCQTIEKVGRFCRPIKSANKCVASVMQKSADFVG